MGAKHSSGSKELSSSELSRIPLEESNAIKEGFSKACRGSPKCPGEDFNKLVKRNWETSLGDALISRLGLKRDSDGSIAFKDFQTFSAKLLTRFTSERAKIVIQLAKDPTKDRVTIGDLKTFTRNLVKSFMIGRTNRGETSWFDGDTGIPQVSESLVSSAGTDDTKELSNDDVSTWLSANPLVMKMMETVVRGFLWLPSGSENAPTSTQTHLIPSCEHPFLPKARFPTLLGLPFVTMLNFELPLEFRHQWRFVYSSYLQGDSFTGLINSILDRGPTILIVKERGSDEVFGGFAPLSWTVSPNWQGNNTAFVFTLKPRLRIYRTTGYNDHFMYLNMNQETMPNGLGMGGQHDYFGFWLDSDFGKGFAAQTCTTFNAKSPLCSTERFQVDCIEVWGVGSEPEKPEERRSILDVDPGAKALLNMAGRATHSDGLRNFSEIDIEQASAEAEMSRKLDASISLDCDDVFVHCEQGSLARAAFPVMEEIRRSGKLCDVTVKAADQLISAHRIVLAATIPYFHAMFTHDMVESKQREITIQGIEPSALETLINYAYSGKVIINCDNVQSILQGAAFLQLDGVRTACGEFLLKTIRPGNVLGVKAFAESMGCANLAQEADKFIMQNFKAVAKMTEFLSLSKSEVQDIIARDHLNVDSEEVVFEALRTWARHDSSRESDFPELLMYVRLPLLTPQYLSDRVAVDEFVRNSLRCRDLLDEARDFHLMPERRCLLQTLRTKPRACNDVVGLIYAVGGLGKSGDSLSTVEYYDPLVGRWRMAEEMIMLRSRVGVGVLRNKLYAIGGYDGSERLATVEEFDPTTKQWRKVTSMHCKRSAVGAASLNDRLYVCGGYDGVCSLNTVECFDAKRNVWSMATSMSKHRSAAGVVTFQQNIYALGGHDGVAIFDSVERFDPNLAQWFPVTPMLTRRCRLGVAVLNNLMYACGGYDGSSYLKSVEVYDVTTDVWKYLAPMNAARSRVALVTNMGKLWAIGGYDGTSTLATMETYDPEKDVWTLAPSMCAHDGGVGVGVIPVTSLHEGFDDSDEDP
ncbi:unnamed protein product [Notodromas monacha]|uniref:Uncharacterized protein n=1 Tax=Notodromas monacha TaxID=399045 RepID=A0A7R9BL58_9CRUS|nr:unnamed protein product [Notodromas monacha]CAG0917233.1 unnamed protein product [Notodromas monacha]